MILKTFVDQNYLKYNSSYLNINSFVHHTKDVSENNRQFVHEILILNCISLFWNQ